MKVIYKKIRFKNFLSFGNSFSEILLNDIKKTIITGKNGNGKSVVLCAITYALFGKPFRHINKPVLVNSINKKECVVEIEFSVNNKEYKVIRGIKPNIFEIYRDGLLLNQDAAAKDYQEYLEKNIIGTNYKTFIQVVILGSARYVPFMSLPAAERRGVIEDLLDIQIFSSMNVLVKEKLNNIKIELNDLTYKIDIIKEKVKYEQTLLSNNEKQREDLITKKRSDIEVYKSKIEENKASVKMLESTIESLTTKIIEKSEFDSKKSKMLEAESKAENTILKLKKQIEFYTNNDSCPTCKQPIEEIFKISKIEKATIKKNSLQEGLNKLSIEYDKITTKLEEINEISKKILAEKNEVLRLNTTIETYEKFIKQLLDEINSIEESAQIVSDNSLNTILEEQESLIKKQSDLLEAKKYFEYSANLLKDGGIKTKIIKQYLPLLNKLINHYLNKFDFYVNFNINEKFEEVIKSRYRDTFSYESFSEGQKTKIDLSILLAFRELSKIKNGVSCNLLLLDEIIDSSLDADSIELFLDLLDNLDYNTNIFVISPKAENLQDRFDKILSVGMVKNFSRIKTIN